MTTEKQLYQAPAMKLIPFYPEGAPLMNSVTLPDIEEEDMGWAPVFPSPTI